MAQPDRRLVLVVGPGRSGTSTVAGILERLGWHVPDQVETDETNPAGFYEPQWVVDVHTEHLRRAGVATLDTDPAVLDHLASAVPHDELREQLAGWLGGHFADHPRVLVKDPRLLWFYDDWVAAAEACGARVDSLLVLREPSAVVASRQTYYDVVPATGAAGWVNAMSLTEQMTRGRTRALVDYRALLGSWRGVMEPVDRALGLGLAGAEADVLAAVDDFVDPSLQRMPRGWDGLAVLPAVAELADDLHRVLLRLADGAGGTDEVDALHGRYATLHEHAAAVVKHHVRRSVRSARREGRRQARRAAAQQGQTPAGTP